MFDIENVDLKSGDYVLPEDRSSQTKINRLRQFLFA
jgi:hypothetical protein